MEILLRSAPHALWIMMPLRTLLLPFPCSQESDSTLLNTEQESLKNVLIVISLTKRLTGCIGSCSSLPLLHGGPDINLVSKSRLGLRVQVPIRVRNLQ